jgi:hypothetical protein
MNRKRIQQLRDHIASLPPKRIDLAGFLNGLHPDDSLGAAAEECGSVACVGGWACILFRPNRKRRGFDFAHEGARALGLLHPNFISITALRLFAGGPRGRAGKKEALRRLDELLETGMIERFE